MHSQHFADHSNADLSYDVWKHDLISSPNLGVVCKGHLHIFTLFLLTSIKCLTQKTWEGYVLSLFSTVVGILISLFWLQIKNFHCRILPDSSVREFKCWQFMQRELFSTTVAKQFFYPMWLSIAKFHWASLNAFLPLSHSHMLEKVT